MVSVKFLFLFSYLFSLFLLFQVVLADKVCSGWTPPSDCKISCDEILIDQETSHQAMEYYKYFVTSPYMNVRFVLDQTNPFMDYNPYTLYVYEWTSSLEEGQDKAKPHNACSSNAGDTDVCTHDYTPGTYVIGVFREDTRPQSGTYNLRLNCVDYCDQCFPDNNCKISCGQTIRGLSTLTEQYVFFTLDSPKNVKFTITPDSDVDYRPLASWASAECPVQTQEGCTDNGQGQTDTCEHKLIQGTYIFGVRKITGTGSYSLQLDCNPIPCTEYSGVYDDSATTDPRTGDTVSKCINFDYTQYSSAKQYRRYYLSGIDCVCEVDYDAHDPVLFVNDKGISNLLGWIEDINRDRRVNIVDISMVARQFGKSFPRKLDVNSDNVIDRKDLDRCANNDPKCDFDKDGDVDVNDVSLVSKAQDKGFKWEDAQKKVDLDHNYAVNIVDVARVAKKFGGIY